MTPFDLLVIGGGINGAGIARDAAGRGLKVLLVEQDDLASHTSSASTKLIHGGLRYLEYRAFRLVRESLAERERLLRLAPHLIRPLRFVMPLGQGMRPGWLIRLGLLFYDRLGGRSSLPRSAALRLSGAAEGAGLAAATRGFAYSDCWADDARLVVLNARDAADRGADIRTRTRFLGAQRGPDRWHAALDDGSQVEARAIVNAAGPWVGAVLGHVAGAAPARAPRLVKGSHIVVPRLFAGDHAYILQNPDKRIVFAIPYEGDFTLIGTTDAAWAGDPAAPAIDAGEAAYLCAAANRWLARRITPADVIHSYSGVRALYDDGAGDPAAVTRDYVLETGAAEAPQLLSVFGGKLTTYRKLAEHALDRLAPFLPPMGKAWTARAPLPGGDIGDFATFLGEVRRRWPFLAPAQAERMARAYGSRIAGVLGDATALDDLGGGLSSRELAYLVDHEWARTADDILWRRTKLGLHIDHAAAARIAARITERT